MIDTTSIRNKTLLFAMSGQLTEQMADDGTGEDLLKRLQAKKRSLEKSGGIKKERQMPVIPEEEKYLDIPSSWQWAYMGDIFQHNTGKALNASDTEGELLEYITTSNLYWDRFELDELRQMHFKPDEIEKCTITKGDLLICEGGDIGRSAIWNFDFDMRIQNHIHKLRGFLPEETCAEYFYYMMWLYKQKGWINGRGIGLQGFSSKRVHSLVIPLPPYQEQFRVAERVREIFEILDVIDELQAQYSSDIEVLKSKLIDIGIQGKLTEQLPEDGTGEELYQQIITAKKELEKEGKAKKSKKLTDISSDELPFDIPHSWKWVRLGDICSKIVDGDHNPPKGIKQKTEYLMGSAININHDRIENLESVRYLSKDVFDEENKRTNLQVDDVLLTIVGTMGRSCVYEGGLNLCFQRSVSVITTLANSKYIKRVLDTSYIQKFMQDNATGAAQLGFYLNKVEKLIIPLPPIQEQKRIVDAIDSMLIQMNG